MTDRTVRVVLQAATQQFESAMRKAQSSTQGLQSNMEKVNKVGGFNDLTQAAAKLQPKLAEVAASVDKTTAVSNTAMGKLAHTVRENEAALSTMGSTATTVGAAWTALNAVVATTGIAYNTLQQTSRAALTTLTGSAREANAQMDKLDAFATTSPFAKDVFITAQQQMLGFGIEAGKVIPYLSAINDATAAMGGNNHTVAELSRIMSQISASAKITATDLREFGNRGIDAATIIGSQMGKTGAQIRDDITKGALDAGDALDALAAGMSERFAGASAGVKDTMAGAFDRVKAAFRDLSAEIVSGAVSPDGGGWLVDWTNGAADLLRTVQKIPDPVKQLLGELSAIGGVSLLAAGGMMKLVTSGMKVHEAFEDLAKINPRLADGLGKVAKGFGLVASALVAATALDALRNTIIGVTQDAETMAGTLSGVERGVLDLDAAFRMLDGSALRSGGFSFSQGWVGDLDNIEDFTKAFLSRVDYMDKEGGKLFGLISTGATDAVNHFKALDAQLAAMDADAAARLFRLLEEGMRAAGATSEDIAAAFPQMFGAARTSLINASDDMQSFSTSTETVLSVMRGDFTPTMEGAAGAIDGTGEAAAEAAEAAKAAEEEWVSYLNALAGGSQSFTDLGAALDAAQAKHRETAESMAEATKSGEASWEDFYDGTSVSINQYLAELEKQIEAQNNWEANLLELSGRASQGLIDHLAEMGAEGAPLVATLVNATDEELARMERNFREAGEDASMGFAEALAEGAPVWAALGQKMGAGAVRGAAAEVAAGKATLQDIINRYDLQATIDANTDPAIRAAEAAMSRIRNMTATMDVTARVRAYHANGLNAPVATGGRVGDVAAAYGLAGGGYVRGPGTTTSDEAATVDLSRDEFVIRAWAASRIGASDLYYMNRTGQIPPRPQNLVQRTATTSTITNNNTSNSSPQITLNVSLPSLTGAAAAEELVREIDALIAQNGA